LGLSVRRPEKLISLLRRAAVYDDSGMAHVLAGAEVMQLFLVGLSLLLIIVGIGFS